MLLSRTDIGFLDATRMITRLANVAVTNTGFVNARSCSQESQTLPPRKQDLEMLLSRTLYSQMLLSRTQDSKTLPPRTHDSQPLLSRTPDSLSLLSCTLDSHMRLSKDRTYRRCCLVHWTVRRRCHEHSRRCCREHSYRNHHATHIRSF